MQLYDLSSGVKGKSRKISDLKYLVLHHTATGPNAKPENIIYRDPNGKRYERPYHFLVTTKGAIYKMRPISSFGTCVAGHNLECVCIAGVGNWNEKDITTPKFLNAMIWLCSLLVKSYKLKLVAHRDLFQTECPGRYFPFDKIVKGVEQVLSGVRDAKAATRS